MKKGFTLVELLVVVAILGILAAVGVVGYSGYIEKSKIQTVKTNYSSVVKYIELELLKCQIGGEIEAVINYELYPGKGHMYQGCKNWQDYAGTGVDAIKFELIFNSIIHELIGIIGRDKGFKNPFYPDLDSTKNQGISYYPSGIGGNRECPKTDIHGRGTIMCGYVSPNNYPAGTGNVHCCALLGPEDTDTIETTILNPYWDE